MVTRPDLPAAPGIELGRVRTWIFVAAAAAVTAAVEVLGTRAGRGPVDPLRMAAVFGLVVGAAALHWSAMRRHVTSTVKGFRRFLEADLMRSKDIFISNVSHGL